MSKQSKTLKEGLAAVKNEIDNGRMIYLDTLPMPSGVTPDNIKSDYINIKDTLLNRHANSKFKLVFGDAINIQRAIDFIVYPGMLQEKLMSRKMGSASLKRLTGKRKSIPNYWACVGYIIIERITQNAKLEALLMEPKPIIDVDVNTIDSAIGTGVVLVPNRNDNMYVGVVRAVVDVLRSTNDSTADERKVALNKLLTGLKQDKSEAVFSGVDVQTDIM